MNCAVFYIRMLVVRSPNYPVCVLAIVDLEWVGLLLNYCC